MELNSLPRYDRSDNPTQCCPRFKPAGWEEQNLHFKDKLFVKAKTRSLLHIPINMGAVFRETFTAIEKAGAADEDDFVVLSREVSAWSGEHYFSVAKDVPGQHMVRLTGDFLTKVFEGPYSNMGQWERDMAAYVESKGKQIGPTYFFLHHLSEVREGLW